VEGPVGEAQERADAVGKAHGHAHAAQPHHGEEPALLHPVEPAQHEVHVDEHDGEA